MGVTYTYLKRSGDILTSFFLLTILSPLMVVTYILVRLTSRGPALYFQERLTTNGRIFKIYKFRTMRVDAEKKTGAVLAEENDNRVTPIGKFLRKSRIDELPQFYNVLIGDMSLVGPRPERPEIAEELCKQFPGFDKRLLVKPGITGLAQVKNGYASTTDSYRQKLSWDLVYINNVSFLMDVKIALQTILVVLFGIGAR